MIGTMSDITIPSVGESITRVALTSWLKAEGDRVEEGDLLCEVESEKATVEIPASRGGILKILMAEGQELDVGAKIGEIHPAGPSPASPAGPCPLPGPSSSPVKAPSPAAKKILAEKNILPEAVNGTGKGGRITKADATKVVALRPQAPKSQGGERSKRTVPMTSLRKSIAQRLVQSQNARATLCTFNEVDLSEVMALRDKYKKSFQEKFQVGLGWMSFFARAVCLGAKEVPQVNAQIEGDSITYYDYVDLGIAVSTPKGLVVPIVRNAESMGLASLEKEIARLAQKCREGRVSIDEMRGGTFTITNGGVFGSMLSTPIINPPQSAILGMHNISPRPRALGHEVVIRPMMYVALSYDHRLIDGREAVTFLKRVKEFLEDPGRMLIEI